MRRAILLSALWCLALPAVITAGQSETGVKAEPWEKFLGTWKQVPGPDGPNILKVEPEGAGVKFSFNCKQGGSCPDVIVCNYDGKRYGAGGAPFETSFRKTGDRAMQEDGFLNSKLTQTVRWQLSSDGNTLTRTYHYINPPGARDQDVNYVYDRSGGPVSKDDPFIGFWKSDWNKSDVLLSTFAAKGDVLTIMNPTGLTVERNCDGEDHPTKLDPTIVYSCRFNGSHTLETVFKKNQKVYLSRTDNVSDDGKKMGAVAKLAEGKTGPEMVFEKVQ